MQQARCKELQKVRPTLAELVKLDQEAQELPGVVPETENLSKLMAKGQEWLAWANSAAKQRAPLKRMREVLHAGLRLGVEVPQVDELRLEIRRREWEEQAKKVTSNCLAHTCQTFELLSLCRTSHALLHGRTAEIETQLASMYYL